jgi:hypothetical protein
MIKRRAGVIVALGALAFGALVTLAHGVEDGLQEDWVQMTLSFFMCAFGFLAGMLGIFTIRVDACLRALENRLPANPLPYRKTVSSLRFALSLWPGAVLVTFLALALIAASRGDFFKFGLGLLASAVAAVVSMLGPLTAGFAKRISRVEALISASEGGAGSQLPPPGGRTAETGDAPYFPGKEKVSG